MLKKNWVKIAIVFLLAPAVQLNAKTMDEFYGSEKYEASYDYNNLRRSLSTDAVYDNRVGYKGLAATGGHVNVKIIESSTGDTVIDKQKRWMSVHTVAKKDDGEAIGALGACKIYHDFMINQENDDEENLKITVNNMSKWRVLREPHQLRKTRYRIYFNERAVKILKRRIRKTSNENVLRVLNRVKDHFSEKVIILYRMHDHLMTEHELPWHSRRWVWSTFTDNNAYCYKGDSFNPEKWYEVIKEISRIQRLVEEAIAEEGVEDPSI